MIDIGIGFVASCNDFVVRMVSATFEDGGLAKSSLCAALDSV